MIYKYTWGGQEGGAVGLPRWSGYIVTTASFPVSLPVDGVSKRPGVTCTDQLVWILADEGRRQITHCRERHSGLSRCQYLGGGAFRDDTNKATRPTVFSSRPPSFPMYSRKSTVVTSVTKSEKGLKRRTDYRSV